MKPNRTKYIAGIILGSLLMLVSPVAALMLSSSGMQRASNTLGSAGIADPNRLAGDIHGVLYASAGGVLGFVAGAIILTVSIVLFVRAGRRGSA